MEGLSVIGKATQNIHAYKKVTGRATYASDLEIPRMLHVKVHRSERAHAKILSIDTSEAEKLPGVKAVITAKDTNKKKFETVWRGIVDRYPLATDRVRYIGEEIAAVAADTELIAEEAVNLIKVEYEDLPTVFDAEEAMGPDAPQIQDVPNNVIPGIWDIDATHGDMEKGFAEADHIFEDRFTTHFSSPCNLEPTVCIAQYDEDDNLVFWENSTDPFQNHRLVAKALEIPGSKIRVKQEFKAGGFCHWQMGLIQYMITAYLAKKVGRPVKFVNSREEELYATRPRGPVITYLKTGVKNDGTITARQVKLINGMGGYADYGPIMLLTSLPGTVGAYSSPNVRLQGKVVYTNTLPTGPSRNFGTKGPQFATESQLDMIADKLGIDPIEFRRKNAVKAGTTGPGGEKIDTCGLQECLDNAKEHIRWDEIRKDKTSSRGVGISVTMNHGEVREGPFGGSVASVMIMEDGRIRIVTGEFEWGQGAHTLFAMIVAEELGVPVEDVEVSPLDTGELPYTLGPYGSGRVTPTGAPAIKIAAIDARNKLFQVAGHMMEANPEDLELKDQKVCVKGSEEKGIPMDKVARFARYNQTGPLQGEMITGRGTYDPPTGYLNPKTMKGNFSQSYIFGAEAAEVEVDTETGQVNLLNYVISPDIGKIINPLAAEGQAHGGVATDMAYTMLEQLVMKDGLIQNPNFTDYKFPTAMDVPRTKAIFVEPHCPLGPYGAKGGTSFFGMGAFSAIPNAIYNAIGVRIMDLPVTPEKILKGLKEKKEGM